MTKVFARANLDGNEIALDMMMAFPSSPFFLFLPQEMKQYDAKN